MPLQKSIDALEKGTFRKIICGASNQSEKQVERITLVYALAGAHVIDIGPDENVYKAAYLGIQKALIHNPDILPPLIMTSINVGDDKHFRKASFELAKCVQCLECLKVCDIKTDPEKCYGCARCVEACQHNVITMVKLPENKKIKNYSAIEIHTGSSSPEEIKVFIDLNRQAMDKSELVSVSINSRRFNSEELLEYTNSVIDYFDKKIIVQIDGISMRGGTKKSSTLQTISAASTLIDGGILDRAFIQLSGGTNYLTREIINLTDLKISGIGFGSLAKKIILSYVEELDEKQFMSDLNRIVKVAENLITA